MMARLTVDGWYVHAYYIILVELATNFRQSFHNLAVLVGAFNNEKAFSVIVKSSLRFVAICSRHSGGIQSAKQ